MLPQSTGHRRPGSTDKTEFRVCSKRVKALFGVPKEECHVCTLHERLWDHYPAHRDDLKNLTPGRWAVHRQLKFHSDQHYRLLSLLLDLRIAIPSTKHTSGSGEKINTLKPRLNLITSWRISFRMTRRRQEKIGSTLWL